MNPTLWRLTSLSRVILLIAAGLAAFPATACLSALPVSFEQVEQESDVVFKATVIADGWVTDAWFRPISGLVIRETQLRLVSTVKGRIASEVIKFRHYASAAYPEFSELPACAPPNYRLAHGRTYLISAHRVADDTYRQAITFSTLRDQSVLLAADAKPNRGTTLSEAVWNEQQRRLNIEKEKDVLEAIKQLDEMSGGLGEDGPKQFERAPKEFERARVLGAIQPLLKSKSCAVAAAAKSVFERQR